MKKTSLSVLFLAVVLLAAACGPSSGGDAQDNNAEAPEADSAPEEPPTAIPTDTPLPPTETPAPTATAEGVLFRDDFNGPLRDEWTILDEDPSRYSIKDGWLEIVAKDRENEDQWIINFFTLPVPEGEFVITTHLRAAPLGNFQQATIFIFENKSNYIALNTGYCEPCQPGGHGYYMETFIDNNPFGNAFINPRGAEDTDVYLRVVNQSGTLTGYYATSPDDWQEAGAFGHFFDFVGIGLGTANINRFGDQEHELVAQFDYFEVSLP